MKNTSKEEMDIKQSPLFKLFVEELKDIYWAEKHLLKNIPKMIKAATSTELKEALESHLNETENQVHRLEDIFESIDIRVRAKRCEGMDGLVEEAKDIIDETEKGSLTRDVGIISAAQKIEHYEIATYGTLKTLASVLSLDAEVMELMDETLAEEKAADLKLSEIAETAVNENARQETE